MRFNFNSKKTIGLFLLLCAAACLLPLIFSACAKPSGSGTKTNESLSQQNVKEGNNMQSTKTDEKESPFACMMNALSQEERKRTFALLDELKSKRKEVKELPDGYAFRYEMSSEVFRDTAEFVIYERLCCSFFEFELVVERENGAMWLRLKGREGVKDFIKTEFSL